MPRRQATAAEKLEAARRRVIDILELRWRHRLPGGRIPRGMVKIMLKRPEFERMVQIVLERKHLPLPDLDFYPEIERRPDGSHVDRMLDELGFDPSDFRCTDCGAETPRGQGRCAKCSHWRKTGVKTP